MRRQRRSGRIAALAAAMAAAPATWVCAQGTCFDAKLISSDVGDRDRLGSAVSIAGNAAALATVTDGNLGVNRRVVYLFRRGPGGWAEEAKFGVPDPFDETLEYGRSVAVGGDVLVVGAISPAGDPLGSQGYAFVYHYNDGRGMWNFVTALAEATSAGEPASIFGWTVGVSPDGHIIVATSGEVLKNGEIIRIAYIYRRDANDEWAMEQRVVFAEPNARWIWIPSNWLDVDDGQFIAGYAGNLDHASDGTAAIFRYDAGAAAWVREALLTSPDGAADSFFGLGVSNHGDVAAVVEPDDVSGFGAVHIYRRAADGSWPLEASLRGNETRALFSDVAVQDGVVMVSGRRSTSGERVVFVYRHDGSGWTADDRALGDDMPVGSSFGRSFDADATGVLVAEMFDDEVQPFGGAGHVFALPTNDDCNANGISDGCDILAGDSDDADGNGVPDECQGPICGGREATVYVDQFGRIVGGPLDGRPYRGLLIATSADDVVMGTIGDDLIIDAGGSAVICGNGGNDRIVGRGHGSPASVGNRAR